jgi:site-specific recombinase XerD
MNELVLFSSNALPTLIDAAGDQARMRFLEFFTGNIRTPNTRRAYAKACEEFRAGCAIAGVSSIAAVQPVHVATYIKQLAHERTAPTVRASPAAIRHLFDWLVVGEIVRVNPAASVRGPRHVVKKGKTPVLSRHSRSCHARASVTRRPLTPERTGRPEWPL